MGSDTSKVSFSGYGSLQRGFAHGEMGDKQLHPAGLLSRWTELIMRM